MVWKRIGAYFIDILFVMLLIEMLAQIRFLNPSFDKYLDVSNEYNEALMDSYENDKNISIMNDEKLGNLFYKIQKYSISNTVAEIVVFLLYFGVFQWWNNGQTLGKKLFKLKIVNNKEKKVNLGILLLRTIFIYSLYLELIFIILLFYLKPLTYVHVYYTIGAFSSAIMYLCLLFIILRKDYLGLHDLLFKTKVIMEKDSIQA